MTEGTGLRDRAAGAALLVAGLGTLLEATTFDVAFLTDPVGPKALPALVALTLMGAGARMLLRPRPSVDLPAGPEVLRMAGAAMAFVAYATLLPWFGFFGSTSLVVFVLGRLFGGPKLGSALTGLVLSGALWLLFVRVLSLPLPVGDLWIR